MIYHFFMFFHREIILFFNKINKQILKYESVRSATADRVDDSVLFKH